MEQKIRLAIQKSGRLSDDSISIIKECGIKFSNGTSKLKATSFNFPIEFLFLRDDDIPGYVEDGVADIGIVGNNVAEEKNNDVQTIKNLGFSKCRLAIAIPRNDEYNGIEDLNGKSIATSYPNLLKSFLSEKNISAEIHEISGSVEIAPSIGLADAICDIVSSGSTLLSNGLKEVESIFNSEAVMIANHQALENKGSDIDKLLFRIDAVQRGNSYRYILLNAPNESKDRIVELLPGMRSPTVLPLATSGWCSIHTVVEEDRFWDVIENLREAGAEGILVVPIEKMIT